MAAVAEGIPESELGALEALVLAAIRWSNMSERTPKLAFERIMAEVRRLRSDEWLERAADEIATQPCAVCGCRELRAFDLVVAMRTHRDERA